MIIAMAIDISLTDTLPRLQKALEEAEMIFQQLSIKEYQVYIVVKVIILLPSTTNRVASYKRNKVMIVQLPMTVLLHHQILLCMFL